MNPETSGVCWFMLDLTLNLRIANSKVMVNNIWPSDHNYLFPIFTGWLEKNPVWMDPGNQVNGRTAGQNAGW